MNENNENATTGSAGAPIEPQPLAPAAPAASTEGIANPFAAVSAPGAPAEPQSAPAAPSPAAPATQPYAVYEPMSQQPAQQAQRAYSAYEQAYGGYGAAQQPPVPPATPTAAPVYGYEPAAAPSGQKRRWPWFLLGLAVGLVIGLGGCASCAGIMYAAHIDDEAVRSMPYGTSDDYGYGYGHDYGYDHDHNYGYGQDGQGQNGQDQGDSSTVPQMPSAPNSESTAGTYTADEIAKAAFPDGVPTEAPGAGSVCKAGVYEVGPSGQIPAGLYFMQGSENAESNFYVFEAVDGATGRYKADDSVVYFGNYFAQLDEGDLVVFKPAGDETMYPAPSESFGPTAPYNDGCYRVGIDIPAGSYTITTYEPSAAVATNECGAFVMKDLDFDEDSIVNSVYVIPGGKQVVTVTDGQYLELFGTTATSVAQG